MNVALGTIGRQFLYQLGMGEAAFVHRSISMHGPTEHPHSRVCGQWQMIAWTFECEEFMYSFIAGIWRVYLVTQTWLQSWWIISLCFIYTYIPCRFQKRLWLHIVAVMIGTFAFPQLMLATSLWKTALGNVHWGSHCVQSWPMKLWKQKGTCQILLIAIWVRFVTHFHWYTLASHH